MGSRLRTLWHLREGGERSDKLFIVAPARALVQRLGPGAGDIDPIVVGPGDQLDSTALVERLGGIGYRREYQVEHRGEFAVRGSIIDVFPSTADAPVRIDLWGDEVDRLSEFAIDDQRSTIAISEVLIFPCRELLADDEVRARAEELVSEEPWGREQWERLANGAQFDGMESWLPWLVDDEEEVLFDRIAGDALVVLVEPQRLRDRAADIINEEADLAASLARTWDVDVGDGDEGLPRLHVGFERLLARCDAPVLTVTNAPDNPDTPSMAAAGFDPVVGDGSRLVTQIKQMLDTGYRVVIGAEGWGRPSACTHCWSNTGCRHRSSNFPSGAGPHGFVHRGRTDPPRSRVAAPQAGDRGRNRRDGPATVASPRTGAAPRREQHFEDLKAGDYVVHATHGVARYEGMVTRAIGGVHRDYLLLAYRGDDKLYVPTDQIDVVRHYTGGDSPSLSRMGGADWQRTRARVKSAVREIAQELVVLYQRRLATPGHAFMVDTPWQREFEAAFPYEETPDQRTPSTT
jgi:transcription-repair coupling factor (superfamily II helicase)